MVTTWPQLMLGGNGDWIQEKGEQGLGGWRLVWMPRAHKSPWMVSVHHRNKAHPQVGAQAAPRPPFEVGERFSNATQCPRPGNRRSVLRALDWTGLHTSSTSAQLCDLEQATEPPRTSVFN